MQKFYTWLALLPLLCSCSNEDMAYTPVPTVSHEHLLNLPDVLYNYSDVALPAYFLSNDNGPVPSSVNGFDNTPDTNPITNAGATLGRVLFYDVSLSANRTTACGTCHRPENSFADSSPFSTGLYGQPTRRNSMTLINNRFYKRGHFFYDERAATLEDQALMPIVDVREMDLTMAQITQRVQQESYYPALFTAAFGSTQVTNEKIADALSQFIRSMVVFNAKYDMGRAQVANMLDDFPNFSEQENRGKQLFLTPVNQGGVGCYACHTTEAFVSPASGPVNNGLDLVSTTDLGAFEHYTDKPELRGAYKIPTLRNINLTGPYMHDARFKTLAQVIEFYNTGVQNHAQLSPLLKGTDGLPRKLNLSEADKLALLRFLFTLSDNSVFSDPRWLDPFINQHL
jgi:cytochrome c peroxidase